MNNVDVGSNMLKRRMMIQDFQALAKMYYMAEQFKLSLFPAGAAGQIADSFAHQCAELQDAKRSVGIGDAFERLGESAKKIYRKWNEVQFLRDCELGLGVVLKDTLSIANGEPLRTSLQEEITIFGGAYCEFRAGEHATHSAFASLLKVFPLIGPTGNLHVFGPANGVLFSVYWQSPSKGDTWFYFGRNREALIFEANEQEKILENKQYELKLYPSRSARPTEYNGKANH